MKKHLTGNTIFFLFALAAILFCSCTPGVSGVETTNGFTITATTTAIKGTAPAYSTVYLFDTGYIPYIDSGFGYGTAVNADENFSFPLASGSYNVFIYDQSDTFAGTAQEVEVSDASESHEQLMEKTTTITGSVTMPENTSALIYIPGSNFYRVLETSGPFTLSGIPDGTFQVTVARLSETYSPLAILHSIEVTITANTTHNCGSFTID